jgi:hypothetical protein
VRAVNVIMKFLDSSLRAVILCCAAAFPLLAACQSGPFKQTARQQTPAPAPPAPEAHILIDEAMRRKPHAILGGTVENIGGGRLEDLSVELELRRRADGAIELRSVPVTPSSLAPGEKGRYSLKVLSEEWLSSRLLRLRSGSRETDVAFKTSPGARRPPERTPDAPPITVTKGQPRPRTGNDDFINTPDTATTVP